MSRRTAPAPGLGAPVVTVALAALVVGALIAGAALLWRPVGQWAARVGAPCQIEVGGERVALSGDQARAATTQAAGAVMADPVDPGPDPDRRTAGESVDIPPGVVEAISAARVSTALTCRWDEPAAARQGLTASGLTPRAQQVLGQVEQTFGPVPTGGYAPGGVSSGHGADSTHYDGRAVDVFFRPATPEARDQGWVLSQWLVAHAEELTVQYVIYDDHWWGVRQSTRGWQAYRAPGGADDPVLRHLDHVHVDVVRGD